VRDDFRRASVQVPGFGMSQCFTEFNKRREVEKTAADMSKESDVERVSVAAYGRIIAAFKNGVRIDVESSQHGVDSKI
jgi:flagellar hook protein FlgE